MTFNISSPHNPCATSLTIQYSILLTVLSSTETQYIFIRKEYNKKKNKFIILYNILPDISLAIDIWLSGMPENGKKVSISKLRFLSDSRDAYMKRICRVLHLYQFPLLDFYRCRFNFSIYYIFFCGCCLALHLHKRMHINICIHHHTGKKSLFFAYSGIFVKVRIIKMEKKRTLNCWHCNNFLFE